MKTNVQKIEKIDIRKIRLDGETQSRVCIDEGVVEEWTQFIRGEIENVSPWAWFIDVTRVSSKKIENMIIDACWVPGSHAVPIFDDHPIHGRVFHSLWLNGVMHRKEIAKEFDVEEKKTVKGYIYFLYAEALDRIKIGYSSSPDCRVSSLQTSSPCQLQLLKAIPGSLKKERDLHLKFKHLRTHGEWFAAHTGEIQTFINYMEATEL